MGMIAIKEAYRAGLLGREFWLRNVVAGVIVGVVALPLAMAFAIASGAKPEQGLYTAIVAGVLVSLLGGSRLQIAGPTGAFIVILAGITARYGIDGLQVATVMAGVILLLLGLARLGTIIKFIPDPVIAGFTAGIGVIIWVGQWKDFFGLHAAGGEHFHQKLWHLLQALPGINLNTTGLALLGLALVLLAPKIKGLSRIPGPLTALVVVTLLQALLHLDGVATIGSAFGGIPQSLPSFHLPAISLPRLIELIGPAFTIAMLGSIESLLSAVVADGMAGTRHDSNQELIGQGIANIVAPLFGGFAATGAIARTATNIRNGGNSPLAGIVHALTLVLIILLLAPLAIYIPLCVLAAILFVVAWNMSELPHVVHMARTAPPPDVAVLLITFFLTVFADLVIAVNIGVILASLLFMSRMASAVAVEELSGEALEGELRAAGIASLPPSVMIYSIDGPFFFGAVESMERLLGSTHTLPATIVFRLRHVPFMDATGLRTFEEAISHLQRQGTRVLLTEANTRVLRKLAKAGIVKQLGREQLFASLGDAVRQAAGG
jgi:SulP family sulfate permease